MDYEVYDARKPTRTDGPYEDKVVAQQVADTLNKFVYDNTLGRVLGEAAEINGPFFVRPATAPPPRRVVAVFDAGQDPHLTTPRIIR